MQKKHRKLLMQMPQDGAPVPAKELAARLGISSRSVINYVGDITSEHPGLIQPTNRGYCLNRGKMQETLLNPEEGLPETSEKRALYMIRRILENEREPFSIFDFEEELFIGESTLRKDLPVMRQKLKEFDLFVEHQGGKLTISGDESNKRRMLSEVIYLEFNDNILSLSAIGRAFPDYDAAALKDLLIQVCNEYCYFLNEFALMNLVLDLLICIDRIKNNHVHMSGKSTYQFGHRERNLAQTIIQHLETHYNVVFNPLETDALTILLFGQLTKIDYKALNLNNIDQAVSPETLSIVATIKEELAVYDFLDFENAELMICFTVHIDNLLKRLENAYFTKNPLTGQIKNNCTFIYELSVLIAGIINRETGYFVSEHETAYIALHIGGMLQIQQSLRNKARCILVFPNYYNYANRMIEQLSQIFGASLVFEDVVTRPEDIERYGDVDMILSTVDMRLSKQAEVIIVNPFLLPHDRTVIQQGLERVIRKKKLIRTKQSLMKISDPDMFSVNQNFNNEYEAIDFMAETMISKGYADVSFLNDVYEREKSYSTAYGEVAVPHALKMDAKKTGMYICINEKAVPWGEAHVRIILLFSVNPRDKNIFYDVFENLIVLLLEPVNVKRIAACKTYLEFVDAILAAVS